LATPHCFTVTNNSITYPGFVKGFYQKIDNIFT